MTTSIEGQLKLPVVNFGKVVNDTVESAKLRNGEMMFTAMELEMIKSRNIVDQITAALAERYRNWRCDIHQEGNTFRFVITSPDNNTWANVLEPAANRSDGNYSYRRSGIGTKYDYAGQLFDRVKASFEDSVHADMKSHALNMLTNWKDGLTITDMWNYYTSGESEI